MLQLSSQSGIPSGMAALSEEDTQKALASVAALPGTGAGCMVQGMGCTVYALGCAGCPEPPPARALAITGEGATCRAR